jgi:ribonuclease VapC
LIVDSSALVALYRRETGFEAILDAVESGGRIPAPVLVEFERVVTRGGSLPADTAQSFLKQLIVRFGVAVEPFTAEDAAIASRANVEHGAGNGRGGRLNLIDLMVYAAARRLNMPILCTGTDFASTGIAIHPASRLA